ncbi:hypothetical protein OEZ85_004114 [Tetradesmus obliquus]|uniref:SBP-type domain-containing protein n=1 Tax=Tetradesmus obliquus TaxID=3088 RepID=A0ABY8UIQ9_TETOB|nr:hypothetical protein OEZ85_004114 [Tetradesmus obliquus]
MAEAVSWSQQSLPAPGQPQQSPPRQFRSQQQDQAANGAAAGQQPQQQVLDSTPASRQQHAGTKGQLAVQVKHEESMPLDLLYSTGAAASDVAQDTTVGAAPAPAPAPPSSTPAMPDSTRGSNAPAAAGSRELGASSPSAGSGRKDGSGRQARVSLNQLMLEGSKYGEPSMPMLTKPDGVACQVPGCHANLNAAGVSTYFRRHRVCLSHAKADQVLISGIAMRFCQQCGIMHPLPDFDGSRKSCRVQLDRHNLRRRCRRKTQTQSNKAAAAAAAAAAGGTRNRGGGNPESSSRGGGGSSVSPSGAAGGSPQRGGGGKRAAARAAAAAFAAAAVSGSDGLSDEDSRDLDGERMMGVGYTYGDADCLGTEYGAGAVDPMLDPAAAASMPVHGGYGGYQQVMPPQQQQQGRRGMRKSGSINSLAWEGPGAAAAVAAAAAEPYAAAAAADDAV